ncbi:hypothetical protein Nepgr_011082 [Nepenthes gracilis]|uniref:Uncharacterized protein n=1 Tax=Nepenthes gracilis TaxID=150966 RepID=A0AAD3XM19_NEPGR|nr:hypothetical protein Nepgr_011082 [Nepenthes gracilis]
MIQKPKTLLLLQAPYGLLQAYTNLSLKAHQAFFVPLRRFWPLVSRHGGRKRRRGRIDSDASSLSHDHKLTILGPLVCAIPLSKLKEKKREG